jgi:hypothetical protein
VRPQPEGLGDDATKESEAVRRPPALRPQRWEALREKRVRAWPVGVSLVPVLVHFISIVVLVTTIVLGLVVVLKVLLPIAEANQALRGKPAERDEETRLKARRDAVKYCTCGAKVPAGAGHCPDCGAGMPPADEPAGGGHRRNPYRRPAGESRGHTGRPITSSAAMQRKDVRRTEPGLLEDAQLPRGG